MGSRTFKRDNHFVPRSYLKRWAEQDGKVWSYRVLVPHPKIAKWKKVSTRGVAFHEHLYTRIAASGESDDLERWLDSEFEAPADAAIEKAITNQRLTPADWRCLARFFAAQDVRTPARLVEILRRGAEQHSVMESALRDTVARVEAMSKADRQKAANASVNDEDNPFRIRIEKDASGTHGWVRAEGVIGRKYWHWIIRSVLQGKAAQALQEHRWTILTPPAGMSWITSDDPVIKVNFNSPQDYGFGGGWGSSGTDLALPLGPQHLLYAQVGRPVPRRGTQVELGLARVLQRLLVEHAHRHVFAAAPDPMVEVLRPRAIDPAELERENEQWMRWHAEQTEVERALIEPRDP